MRVLLVLAMIPLLAACSVFSSSEPSATLVDTQPTETAAGTTDTTGAPAAGTSTDPASVTPTPVAATPTPAANASVAAKTPAPVPALGRAGAQRVVDRSGHLRQVGRIVDRHGTLQCSTPGEPRPGACSER